MPAVRLEEKRERCLESIQITATLLRGDDTFWTKDMLARLERIAADAADAIEIQKRIEKRDARKAKEAT